MAQWGARAVNNMGKSSRSLKLQLTELGAVEVLSDILANNSTTTAATTISNLNHVNSFTAGLSAATAGVSRKESPVPPAAQWILAALDTLQSQSSTATTGAERTSFNNGSSSAAGNSSGNSMATLTGSSGSLWSDSANATVQAVFGTPTPSAASRRRSSEDIV